MMADARERLLLALREHALVIGEVTLTSGRVAQYLIDAKRTILLRDGFLALGELVAARAADWDATAVGGMTIGADPIACAALAGGANAIANATHRTAPTSPASAVLPRLSHHSRERAEERR
jgi:orotate phosphoribosyltransferase